MSGVFIRYAINTNCIFYLYYTILRLLSSPSRVRGGMRDNRQEAVGGEAPLPIRATARLPKTAPVGRLRYPPYSLFPIPSPPNLLWTTLFFFGKVIIIYKRKEMLRNVETFAFFFIGLTPQAKRLHSRHAKT